MEITRSGILRECMEEKNREMHKYSKHEAGLIPLEGYEKHFEDLKVTCELLRGMIRNAEDRERETRLADWQLEVIKADCAREHPKLDLEPAEAPGLPLNGCGDWSMAAIAAGTAPYPADKKWNPETQEWEPLMTPDEAILRRRYRQAEGFKPEPVVYPGGEE